MRSVFGAGLLAILLLGIPGVAVAARNVTVVADCTDALPECIGPGELSSPFNASADNTQIEAGVIVAALTGGATVVISTGSTGAQAGNLVVSTAINFGGNPGVNTLSLTAAGSLTNSAIVAGAGTVNLTAAASITVMTVSAATISITATSAAGNLIPSGSSLVGADVSMSAAGTTGIGTSSSSMQLAGTSSLTLQVTNATGEIYVNSPQSLSSLDVTTNGGAARITAGVDILTYNTAQLLNGSLPGTDVSFVNTGAGGSGVILLNSVTTSGLSVRSTNAAIGDGNGASNNITTGTAALTAAGSIGGSNAIETTVTSAALTVTGTGTVSIAESNDLDLGGSSNANGDIFITAAGTLDCGGGVNVAGSGTRIDLRAANVVLSTGCSLGTASGPIVLVDTTTFTNNAGAGVLSPGSGSRWLIKSSTTGNTALGGLVPDQGLLGDVAPDPSLYAGSRILILSQASAVCAFSAGTLTVTVDGGTAALTRTPPGQIKLNKWPCAGATTSTTDTIQVNGGNLADVVTVTGSFAPGATAEGVGSSEIEFAFALGPGADKVTVNYTDADELIPFGATGIDVGGDGDVDITASAAGADTLKVMAKGGLDTIDASLYTGGSKLYLYGGDGDDSIYGSTAIDWLYGDAGADAVYGGDGNDILYGGAGDDSYYGEAGNDKLFQDATPDGNDTFHGGTDTDTVDYSRRSGGVVVTLGNGIADDGEAGLETDFVDTDVESATGGSGADLLTGNAASNTLRGNGGDDTLFGNAGADKLYGGDGNDHLDGGANTDTFFGDAGDDTFINDDGVPETVNCGAGAADDPQPTPNDTYLACELI